MSADGPNVIPIGRVACDPLDDGADQHTCGPCVCLDCGHKWEGVVPSGIGWIDCPSCGTEKGRRETAVQPDETWECGCGNQLFYMTPDGHLCPVCGVYQRYD